MAILLALQCLLVSNAVAVETDAFETSLAPLIKQHCVKCHGARENLEGDVDLLNLSGELLAENTELIRNLVDVLDLEEMPPEDEPPLPPDLRQKAVAQLRSILHSIVAKENSYAHAPIRRMNRFQYNNAVIDLLDLKCTVFSLPERMMREHNGYFQPASGKMADVVTVGSRPLGKSQLIEPRLSGVAPFPQDLRAEHGFDNRGDHLSLSPLLMESFLKLGQSITQSRDFTRKNVGLWDTFFEPPREEDQNLAVRSRLKPFLSRAFRHSIDTEALERYASYVDNQLDFGVGFPQAMKSVVAAIIASPKFLYLYDKPGHHESPESVDDFELASRMSFFLWGSLPDEQLLDLAAAGELKQPKVLDDQIERMLHNRKLKRFCDSFPTQWLQLERIISSTPQREKFPQFYFLKFRASMHMMLEPLLLFETILIENRPITQLIDSDFTYRSSLLQDAYGELSSEPKNGKKGGNEVVVLKFRRVPLTDRRNGGVITNAAVMTMTSGPERTKPITRGAWLAGVVFNNPPDPPPANVPPLAESSTEGDENLTLRERLSAHRQRADCKGCHEQIDPLGFALENYDAIGVWRDEYANGRNVDMAGTLFRKHEFTNVVEFKDAILVEKDRFTRGLAGHLLSFALARPLSAADQPALDQITSATAENQYKIQTLIKQVILSEPFQSKSGDQAKKQVGPVPTGHLRTGR